MISIIKRGSVTTTRCAKCGCVFTYEDEDIETKVHDFPGTAVHGFVENYIKCPQCKDRIIIEATR